MRTLDAPAADVLAVCALTEAAPDTLTVAAALTRAVVSMRLRDCASCVVVDFLGYSILFGGVNSGYDDKTRLSWILLMKDASV